MKPKTDKPKGPEHNVKVASGILLFVGVATVLASIASMFIKSLWAYFTPPAIILGIAYLVCYFFLRKKSLIALTIATTLMILDLAIVLLVTITGAFFGVGALVVKGIFTHYLVNGLKALIAEKKEFKRNLGTGIAIGFVIYLAVWFIAINFYVMMPESESDCRFFKGDDYDVCVLSSVVKTRDSSKCEKIADEGLALFCNKVAIYDSAICENALTTMPDFYYYCLALTSHDGQKDYCLKAPPGQYQDECLMFFG